MNELLPIDRSIAPISWLFSLILLLLGYRLFPQIAFELRYILPGYLIYMLCGGITGYAIGRHLRTARELGIWGAAGSGGLLLFIFLTSPNLAWAGMLVLYLLLPYWAGLLLARRHYTWFLGLFGAILGGVYLLSRSHSDPLPAFLFLSLWTITGFWVGRRESDKMPLWRLFLQLNGFLLAYFLLSLIVAPEMWYYGLFPSAVLSGAGLLVSRAHWGLLLPLLLSVWLYAVELHPIKFVDDAVEKVDGQYHFPPDALFTDLDGDTVAVLGRNRPVIIEAFSRGCGACAAQMVDLEPLFSRLEQEKDVVVRYLYQPECFPHCDSILRPTVYYKNFKDKIIFNHDRRFFQDSACHRGVPYTLFFDEENRLQYFMRGYNRKYRKKCIRRIEEVMGPMAPK